MPPTGGGPSITRVTVRTAEPAWARDPAEAFPEDDPGAGRELEDVAHPRAGQEHAMRPELHGPPDPQLRVEQHRRDR